MRFIETTKLAEFISDFKKISGRRPVCKMHDEALGMDVMSLQNESILGDSDYLKEVASVIRVISSIIYHPHLYNKREEIVLRVEQAGHLGNEEFREVLRDTKLWKQHGISMIPEEVHYHQQIDELRIYENRFLTMLIDLLAREMDKYSAFYTSKLPTVGVNNSRLKSGDIGKILMTVDNISRRIRYIKSTYFYKEVSKGKPLSGRIRPTNILTKDRLYRVCYTFYLKFVSYDDVSVIKEDLRTYYLVHLFSALDKAGFAVHSDGESIFGNHDNGLKLNINFPTPDSISMKVTHDGKGRVTHLLRFATGEEPFEPVGGYDTETAISLWQLFSLDGGSLRYYASEADMIAKWIEDTTRVIELDRFTYERFCPICRKRNIQKDKNLCSCQECGSKYMFLPDTESDVAWFRVIR